jgi:ubiquinone/menaquinone biosynthesis C-methylase UbiE
MEPTRTTTDPCLLVDRDGKYKPYEYWLSTCGLHQLYDYALNLLGTLDGRQILDCGCGIGNTAIMFNRRGAIVHGFDIDDGVLDDARAIASANKVSVEYSNQRFEELDYPNASFDLAFGSCVIHHVEVERAAQQLGRVLKPGGKAVFIENSSRNSLLMLARLMLVGRLGVPKYGDDDEEHPLRDDEIDCLRQHFPGRVTVHFPSLVLFRLLDFYIFRRRSKILTSLMQATDRSVGKIRRLRRYSYFQILELERE